MAEKGSFEGANENIDELLNIDLEGKSEDELTEIQTQITNAFQNASEEEMQALAMVSRKINLALSEIASKRNEGISDETAREEGAEAIPDHEQTPEEALEIPPSDPDVVEGNLVPIDKKPEEEIVTPATPEKPETNNAGEAYEKSEHKTEEIVDKQDKNNIDSEDWENNPILQLEGSGGNLQEWHIAHKSKDSVIFKRNDGNRVSTKVVKISDLEKWYPDIQKDLEEIDLNRTNSVDVSKKSKSDIPADIEIPPSIEEKELKEVEQEIERMAPEEKVDLENGLNKWGFILDEKKNEFFAKAFGWAAEKSKSSLFNRLGHGNNLASRFADGMKETFMRDQEASRARAMQMRPGARKAIRSNVLLASNIAKYGRTITDFTGLSLASPTRWIMLASQVFARVADAGKEARLKNEEVLDRTRIQDINEAADQAFEIYKIAELNSAGNVTKETLKQSYLQTLPQDILNRIGQNTKETDSFFQRAVRNDIGWSIGRLRQNIRKIEDDPSYNETERKQEIQSLIAREQKNLIDYDRILTQTGTADTWAIAGKYLNMAGKTVSAAVSVETIALTGEKIIEHLSNLLSHSESATEAAAVLAANDTISKDSISHDVADRLGLHPDTSTHLDTAHAQAIDSAHTHVTDSTTHLDSLGAQENIASSQDNEAVSYAIKQQEALERMGEHSSETFGTIHQGGSVTKTIDEMVKHGLISQEDAHIARNNPFSGGMRGEEFIPLDKAGLSYDGNEVHFIPGHDGEAPRFEVVQADGHQFGSDQDLYNRYIKLGKEPPEWLKKSVEKGWDIPHVEGGDIEASLNNNGVADSISTIATPDTAVTDSITSTADTLTSGNTNNTVDSITHTVDSVAQADTTHALDSVSNTIDSTKTVTDSVHKVTKATGETDSGINWVKAAEVGGTLVGGGALIYGGKKLYDRFKAKKESERISIAPKKSRKRKELKTNESEPEEQAAEIKKYPSMDIDPEAVPGVEDISKLSKEEQLKKFVEIVNYDKTFTNEEVARLENLIKTDKYYGAYNMLWNKWGAEEITDAGKVNIEAGFELLNQFTHKDAKNEYIKFRKKVFFAKKEHRKSTSKLESKQVESERLKTGPDQLRNILDTAQVVGTINLDKKVFSDEELANLINELKTETSMTNDDLAFLAKLNERHNKEGTANDTKDETARFNMLNIRIGAFLSKKLNK